MSRPFKYTNILTKTFLEQECESCHGKTHFNRNYWKKFLTIKLTTELQLDKTQ